jgi:Uma2 family endonuclease
MNKNDNDDNKKNLYIGAIQKDLEDPEKTMMVAEEPAYKLDYEDETESNRKDSFRVLDGEKTIGDKTLADYMALPDDARVELIDGVFYDMAAPNTAHQDIGAELITIFRSFVKKNRGSCKAFYELDVQLDKDDKTIVRPDILVACHREQILKARFYGAPDLVMEIVSPSNWKTDVFKKKEKYERAGVREYWMVFPEDQKVTVCDFEGKAKDMDYTFHDKIPVKIWGGKCVIDFEEIYQEAKFLLDPSED